MHTTDTKAFTTPQRRRRAHMLLTGALLASATVATNGCADLEQAEPVSSQPQPLDTAQAGAAIANHPLFSQLSLHGTTVVAGMVTSISTMPPQDVSELEVALQSCSNAAECEAVTQEAFGLGAQDIDPAATMAAQIAADVGLSGAPQSVVYEAFQHAQVLVDDEGDDNAMLGAVLPDPTLPCAANSSCVNELGISLAMVKGEYLAALVQHHGSGGSPTQAQSQAGLGSASSALAPAIVAAIVAGGVALIGIVVDAVWVPGEDDRECMHDSDCPTTEYCHRVGANDCRPRRTLNSGCSRDTQCATGCCRWNWGWMRCRPSNRCN